MVDSGGGLRLRNLAFLIMLIFAARGMIINKTVKKDFLRIYLLFLGSLVPAILISFSNGIPLGSILVWLVSFFLIPLFYFYIKGSELSQNNFIVSGVLFSIIVIILFFGRLLDVGFIVTANEYLANHSDGFFGYKNFLSGDVLPNVYFQGTLSLIICGVLSLQKNSYASFFVILLAVILAPSRFGFLVLTLWASFLFFRKSWTHLSLLPIIGGIAFLILNNLAFGKELFSVFSGESDAIDIRNGHFSSILHVFKENPIYFFFGQGPGSIFFSTGISSLADNIEISQLEYIRKYGIISFIFLCLMYFYPVLKKAKSHIYIKGALISYFIVSFSNPVLFSIFSMLFLTFAYIQVLEYRIKPNL